jgi:YD repeat-containing protein
MNGIFLRQGLLALLLAVVSLNCAMAVAGKEIYQYDVLGRLEKVTFADNTTIQYTYDSAGNRKTTGPASAAATAGGTFLFLSGTHTMNGNSGDNAVATIKNSGTQAITAIGYTCSGGSFHIYGSGTASLQPGQSGTYQCQAGGSGSYSNASITVTGTGAANSPYTTPSW